jgi:aspartyl protease family protein
MILKTRNNSFHLKIFLVLLNLVLIGFNSCTGCSKSRIQREKLKKQSKVSTTIEELNRGTNQIPLIKDESGVYQIPVLINGVEMFFVFDTGASLISISNVEANFLFKQGKLSKEDVLGEVNFSDANGDISVGTVINLREVTLGNRVLKNVQASVVDNSVAPLLFGQSALAQFGKVSIDYKRQLLIIE